MEPVNPPTFCCGWTCPANFGRRCWIVKYISMSDTLADESHSFRGGFSCSEGIWGIYCHLLPPRARSFLILFIFLALSSHTVLDPAGCVLFVFPSLMLLTAFVHHVLCYFCPLSVLFHSPVWLQTVAPGVGGWSHVTPSAACPRPPALVSSAAALTNLSVAGLARVVPHVSCDDLHLITVLGWECETCWEM